MNDLMAIDVRSLGTFSVTICGHSEVRWRASRARELLQYLLLRPGAVVPTETLRDTLWPHSSEPTNSRTSLKVAAHMLRRTLTDHLRAACVADRPPVRLVTCEEGYALEVHDLRVDFQIFDELIDRGHSTETKGRNAEAAGLFRAAVDLYKGDFLADTEAEWACAHREWLRNRYIYALRQLSKLSLADSDHLSVMRWCRLLIDVEPYDEDAYRELMVAHARLGQLNQVRRWYELCSDRLHSGLDISPSQETERVYVQAIHRPG